MGQPGVVSETTTSTRPPSCMSIDLTIPRSTMLWRSSGSMTGRRASVICSLVGMPLIVANKPENDTGGARRPRRLREERYYSLPANMRPAVLPVTRTSPGGYGGSGLTDAVGHVRHEVIGAALEILASGLDLGLDAAPVATHEALGLG